MKQIRDVLEVIWILLRQFPATYFCLLAFLVTVSLLLNWKIAAVCVAAAAISATLVGGFSLWISTRDL